MFSCCLWQINILNYKFQLSFHFGNCHRQNIEVALSNVRGKHKTIIATDKYF